jgi:hypothetical protein
VEISGTTGGAGVRVDYESTTLTGRHAPFVPIKMGDNFTVISQANVPAEWDIPNAGEVADPTNVRHIGFVLYHNGDAHDFDFCVTRIRPLIGKCGDYSQIEANDYIVFNNVWGKDESPAVTDYAQCLFSQGDGPDAVMGWSWRWPDSDSWQVRAYPEIMAGDTPWGDTFTGHGFPVDIDADVSFSFDLDLLADDNGVYNFAPEVWLTTDDTPASDEIAYEVMIWLDYNNMTPAGTEQANRYYDPLYGFPFEVWVNEDHTPGGGTDEQWTYIALRSRATIHSGTIAIHPMMDHLRAEGIISDDVYYYAGVEVGNEIVHGTGTAVIRDFSVDVWSAGL